MQLESTYTRTKYPLTKTPQLNFKLSEIYQIIEGSNKCLMEIIKGNTNCSKIIIIRSFQNKDLRNFKYAFHYISSSQDQPSLMKLRKWINCLMQSNVKVFQCTRTFQSINCQFTIAFIIHPNEKFHEIDLYIDLSNWFRKVKK